MGIDSEKASQWLDICQNLASSGESSKAFTKSALELQQLTSESGLSYQSLIQNYSEKISELGNIEQNIETKHRELQALKQKSTNEKKRGDETIASINTALSKARDKFKKEKQNLQTKLKAFMVEHHLS